MSPEGAKGGLPWFSVVTLLSPLRGSCFKRGITGGLSPRPNTVAASRLISVSLSGLHRGRSSFCQSVQSSNLCNHRRELFLLSIVPRTTAGSTGPGAFAAGWTLRTNGSPIGYRERVNGDGEDDAKGHSQNGGDRPGSRGGRDGSCGQRMSGQRGRCDGPQRRDARRAEHRDHRRRRPRATAHLPVHEAARPEVPRGLRHLGLQPKLRRQAAEKVQAPRQRVRRLSRHARGREGP